MVGILTGVALAAIAFLVAQVTPRRGSRRRGQVAAPGAGSYRFVIMRGCLRSEAALGMPLDELLATNVAQYQVWILRLQALARKVA